MSNERKGGRTLLNAFLGRPGQQDIPQKPEKVYSLKDMLQDLIQIPDQVWGRYAFSRDPLRGKFTPEQIDDLAEKAVLCGKEEAAVLTAQLGASTPTALAEKLELVVDYPLQPAGDSHVTFAQFVAPNKVTIFRHSLEKAGELLTDNGVRKVMGSLSPKEVLMGHELFHFWEETHSKTIFTRTEKVELWSLPFFKNRSTIRSLSEIAGMSFAKELCGLPYSPFVLDVFFIYGYTKEAASNLYQEITDLARSLGYDIPLREMVPNL